MLSLVAITNVKIGGTLTRSFTGKIFPLTTAQLTGLTAKDNMPNLNWSTIWCANEDGYPSLYAPYNIPEAKPRTIYWDGSTTKTAPLQEERAFGCNFFPCVLQSPQRKKEESFMEKLNFASDYLEGAHPLILEQLLKANLEKNPGYSADKYCASAKEKIRAACNCPEAEIHFLVGGTQTNAMVIKYLLSPYQGVIAPATGHISLHESGAIEHGGHKVLCVPEYNGKLKATDVEKLVKDFQNDGNKDMMEAMALQIPIRCMMSMSMGVLSEKMANGILDILNDKGVCKGLGKILSGIGNALKNMKNLFNSI